MFPVTAPPVIPAAFFSIVLGIAGLGAAWRRAHQAWGLPAAIGELLMLAATLVWCLVLILYILKWRWARQKAVDEALHPVQCCFIGLAGVSTMLIGGAILPYERTIAAVLVIAGGLFTLGFAVWRTGGLWQGDRDEASNTAVLYLPTVAGSFVAATMLAAFGHQDWGQMAFGAGCFSWLAIESVLLHRLYNFPSLPTALRPTLGVQLAPPSVGLIAYISVSAGPPDILMHAMLGYALLQSLILLRLMPWIGQADYVPAYWGFSFGLTALATAPLAILVRGASPASVLAPFLFVVVNILIILLLAGTVRLLLQGRLLPPSSATLQPSIPK